MKKNLLALSLFISSALYSFAQKEANVWYFGDYAGLDFNSGVPTPINNSQLHTIEGCASIADKSTGKILFYTDGMSVWNKNNTIMTNGAGLLGDSSSTQSGVVIPKPGSSTLFYLFTADAQVGDWTGNNGDFCYNIVDMSQSGGLGAITTKNQVLMSGMVEKIAAVRACNGTDIWVIAHQWNSNAFYAYRVTSSGISAPVITNAGIVHQDVGSLQMAEAIGYMKCSPNGKKIALACYEELNTVQIFDFDNSTGVISNPITDTDFPNVSGEDGPYGISFSPDNSRLYVGAFGDVGFFGTSYVYQYNMNAGNNAAILASKTAVLTDVSDYIGALQIGPDGKIYVAKQDQNGLGNYLDVIQNPNALGAACNYTANGVFLGGNGQCVYGLPDMIESYLSVPITATLTYTDCGGNHSLSFTDNALNGAIATSWNFGDPGSGASNTSLLQNPSHTFSSSGSYTVTVYFSTSCQVDSFKQTVTAGGGGNSATAGPDTTLCSGNFVQLQASNGTKYAWSPSGSLNDTTVSNPYAIPTVTTTYTVIVTTAGCSSTATVTVNVVTSPPTPNITQSGDTLFCSFDTSYVAYQWYDSTTLINGATHPYVVVSHNGNYNVSVRNKNGCGIAVGINVILEGVNNYQAVNPISLSPNPATDELSLSGKLNGDKIRISIYDILGRNVYSSEEYGSNSFRKQIDVRSFSKGIYLVKAEQAGNSKWVGKFIKD